MPIIQKREKVTLAPLQARVDALLIQKLDRYCEYTNLNKSEIVAQALEYVMENDRQFAVVDSVPALDDGLPIVAKKKRGRKPKTS